VALIRCSSATHAFNPDQRYVELVIDRARTTLTSLTVSGPPAAEIAPPGYYLLFILDFAGTPSVARFFKVSSSYPVVQGVETREDTPTAQYSFPVLEPGQTSEATFRFVNVGVGQLKLREASLEGDLRDETDPGSPNFGIPPKLKNTELVIAPDTANPGNSAVLKVKFTPTDYGTYAGTVWVSTNAPDARGFKISLTARVVGLALEITPVGPRLPGLAFGDVLIEPARPLRSRCGIWEGLTPSFPI
jgi:hypothetical protein